MFFIRITLSPVNGFWMIISNILALTVFDEWIIGNANFCHFISLLSNLLYIFSLFAFAFYMYLHLSLLHDFKMYVLVFKRANLNSNIQKTKFGGTHNHLPSCICHFALTIIRMTLDTCSLTIIQYSIAKHSLSSKCSFHSFDAYEHFLVI